MKLPKRIVLVQNDTYLIETRKVLLEQQGYWVDSARSVEEARTFCQQSACDLVIVDSEEDYRAALDLCEEIKLENPEVSVAVMTWDASELDSDCPDQIIRRQKGPGELLNKVRLALA